MCNISFQVQYCVYHYCVIDAYCELLLLCHVYVLCIVEKVVISRTDKTQGGANAETSEANLLPKLQTGVALTTHALLYEKVLSEQRQKPHDQNEPMKKITAQSR